MSSRTEAMNDRAKLVNETLARSEAADTSLLDEVLTQTIVNLDATAQRYAVAIHEPGLGHLQRAMTTARAINRLRKAITDEIMKDVMALMNTPLGFKTDSGTKKRPALYTQAEVKEVLIAALLNGVFPVNNEFNIISGQLYIAQEGYRRKVKETIGLTDLEIAPSAPYKNSDGRTCVRFCARWKLFGKPMELASGDGKPGRTFAIIDYEGSSPDNLVGKAIRKGLKAVYEMVHGSDHTLDDTEDVGHTAARTDAKPTRTQQLAAALGAAESPSTTVAHVAGDAPGVPAEGQGDPEPGSGQMFPDDPPPAAEDLERTDWIHRLEEQIASAKTAKEKRDLGASLVANRDELGDEEFQRLVDKLNPVGAKR